MQILIGDGTRYTDMNPVVVVAMANGSETTCMMLILFLKLIIVRFPPVGFWADPKLSLSCSKFHSNLLEMSRVPERLLLSKYLPRNYSNLY
jgi:hypothetical protein